MPTRLTTEQVPAYLTGLQVLGGGGAGDPRVLRPSLDACRWPVDVHGVGEIDPGTPCIAVGIGGSTLVVAERLPEVGPYDRAVAAVERWTGTRAEAVCPIELAGINGLAALPLGAERLLVDADLMGRAFPRVDQISPFVDGVPDLVLACATGGEGVLVLADPRPEDAEHVLRSAFETAGGWSGVVLGGFTVGDLREHGVLDSLTRALSIGAAWGDAPTLADLAAALGGRLVAAGRVEGVHHDHDEHRLVTMDVDGASGEVVRVVAGSEFLAVVVDGETVAAPPDIVVVADQLSREIVPCGDISAGRTVAVLALPAPGYWSCTPARRERVGPARSGLRDLMGPPP